LASFEAGDPIPLREALVDDADERFTISDKLWNGHCARTTKNVARGVGFTAFLADLDRPANTLVARYGKDGKECLIPQGGRNPRMLTPRECANLQGFPENFIIAQAKTVAYRQFGNAVAVPVVIELARQIATHLETSIERGRDGKPKVRRIQ
jgi:DNA (cytosine-5)-methyltransferase 1